MVLIKKILRCLTGSGMSPKEVQEKLGIPSVSGWKVFHVEKNVFIVGIEGGQEGCLRLEVCEKYVYVSVFDTALPSDVIGGAVPTDSGICEWKNIYPIMDELERRPQCSAP